MNDAAIEQYLSDIAADEEASAHEARLDLLKDKTMRAYFALRVWVDAGRFQLNEEEYSNTDFPNPLDDHLAVLCGYKGAADMADNWRDETLAVLAGLVGPNGWAIYKMLLARRGKK